MKPQLSRTGVNALLLVALLASPVAAQDQDLRHEIAALKKGQEEIQKQLAELIKLVKPQPAAAARKGVQVENEVFNLGANPTNGVDTAKLTLVEFSDYQ